jgi:hypothetical protein
MGGTVLLFALSSVQLLMEGRPASTMMVESSKSSTGKEDESGESVDAMTRVMESLLEVATGSTGNSSTVHEMSMATGEGTVARDRTWSIAFSASAAGLTEKQIQCLGSRDNIIVKN